jgi:hypothetical protein
MQLAKAAAKFYAKQVAWRANPPAMFGDVLSARSNIVTTCLARDTNDFAQIFSHVRASPATTRGFCFLDAKQDNNKISIPDGVNKFATSFVVDNVTCNTLHLLDELLFQTRLPFGHSVFVLTAQPDVAKVLKHRFDAKTLFDATGTKMLSRPYVEFVINNGLYGTSKEAKAKVVDLMVGSNSETILDAFCQQVLKEKSRHVVELAQDFAQVAMLEHAALRSAYA